MDDMTTANAMVCGKHLTALHDHLHHMLVTEFLCCLCRVLIDYEDVHAGIVLPVSLKSSRILLWWRWNDCNPCSLLGDTGFLHINASQLCIDQLNFLIVQYANVFYLHLVVSASKSIRPSISFDTTSPPDNPFTSSTS